MSRRIPIRFPAPRPVSKGKGEKRAADLESMAQVLEDFADDVKNEEERRLWREVGQTYRAAARNILRNAKAEREK